MVVAALNSKDRGFLKPSSPICLSIVALTFHNIFQALVIDMKNSQEDKHQWNTRVLHTQMCFIYSEVAPVQSGISFYQLKK